MMHSITFGKYLKYLRKANGYTMSEFCETFGMSDELQSKYENDMEKPSDARAIEIAEFLGYERNCYTVKLMLKKLSEWKKIA